MLHKVTGEGIRTLSVSFKSINKITRNNIMTFSEKEQEGESGNKRPKMPMIQDGRE